MTRRPLLPRNNRAAINTQGRGPAMAASWATMIRTSWTRVASIEETLGLWAASLREIKPRIQLILGVEHETHRFEINVYQ